MWHVAVRRAEEGWVEERGSHGWAATGWTERSRAIVEARVGRDEITLRLKPHVHWRRRTDYKTERERERKR